jgi:hypothetical protein
MSKGFLERLMDIGVAGTALSNTTTQTSLMLGNTGEQGTLPAKYFERIGKALKIRAAGRISTVVTTPGTLTLALRFGSIDVWTSGAMTLNVVAKTNVPWILDLEVFSRAIGSATSANLLGIGSFLSEAVIASVAPTAGGQLTHVLPYNTAPAVGSGFDSSAAQLIDLMGTWSVANASNSIRLETLSVDMWS